MSKFPGQPNFDDVARDLETLCRDLPETLSLDDVKRHPGLRRIVIAADDISNRIDRRALEWCKMQPADPK